MAIIRQPEDLSGEWMSEFLRLKKEMPVLGVGLGLRGDICNGILEHKEEIDFLEITPENYRDNNASLKWLAGFAEIFPLVSHSVSLSVGSLDPLDYSLLRSIRQFLNRFGLSWWSDHLCFTGVDGESGNDLFPLPWTEEAVRQVAGKAKEAQSVVSKPLILENIPYYTRMPSADYSEPEFIRRVLEESDCGLLLDLNNLYVNSLNHDFDPKKFLDQLPLERVVQIHLAGPGRFGTRVIDTHGAAVPEPVFELLDYVLAKNIAVKAVMIERDQHFPDFAALLAELRKIREIWNCHCKSLQPVAQKTAVDEQIHSAELISQVPLNAVSELAELPAGVEEDGEWNESAEKLLETKKNDQRVSAFTGHAIDPAIILKDLAQYERRWMELWTEIKGESPYGIDRQDEFRPRFARLPSAEDNFDLKALAIYAWLRDSNRDSLMRRVFPATFELLEKDWRDLLDEYFYQFKAQYSDNRKIGDRFPEFVSLHCLRYQAAYPFLFELVEYEQMKYAAARKHEVTDFCGDVYLGSAAQLKERRPLVNPELMIRSFIYPVDQIANSLLSDENFSSQALDVPLQLAFLPSNWNSRVLRLNGLNLRLIDMARTGQLAYSGMMAAQMGENERQSPEKIADMIRIFQNLHDSKVFVGCVPVDYVNHSWSSYGKAVQDLPPHETVLLALKNFENDGKKSGYAVDLGCGSGRDCKQLLRSGWNVFAVDQCEEALATLTDAKDGWQVSQLNTFLGRMEDATLPEADLINAGVSLPFCPPDKFEQLWNNVRRSLRSGGRFSGHFFGKSDDWALSKTMSFFSADEIKKLFEDFELELYNEVLGPVPIVPSGFRYGHIFEIVARKIRVDR